MCEQWAEPRWDSLAYRRRHLCSTTRLWERNFVKQRTSEPNAASQYNPNFSRDRVEQLEMKCARGECGSFIQGNHRTKTFYLRVDEFDKFGGKIGVSRGEFTEYIFVIRQADGSVHGFPITWEELVRNKGVKGTKQ